MNEIQDNFKFKYSENLLCSLCETAEEKAVHLLKCPKLINDLKVGEFLNEIKTEVMFKDISNQDKTCQVWKTILEILNGKKKKD